MASEDESFLGTPLLATAVLLFLLTALLGLGGQFMRSTGVSHWDLVFQIVTLGGGVAVMMIAVWAIRVLWTYATGAEM